MRNGRRGSPATIATTLTAAISAAIPTAWRPDAVAAFPPAVFIAARFVESACIADADATVVIATTDHTGRQADQRNQTDGWYLPASRDAIHRGS
jgi:hypothetical protein